MALMTCEEFRIKRDQNALDGFKLRWPVLNGKKQATQKKIEAIKVVMGTWVVTESTKKQLAEEIAKLHVKINEIASEMTMIENEAPIRKMNLGLIPVPKEPTPELKRRLTVFMLQAGRDMLMKGIPE